MNGVRSPYEDRGGGGTGRGGGGGGRCGIVLLLLLNGIIRIFKRLYFGISLARLKMRGSAIPSQRSKQRLITALDRLFDPLRVFALALIGPFCGAGAKIVMTLSSGILVSG